MLFVYVFIFVFKIRIFNSKEKMIFDEPLIIQVKIFHKNLSIKFSRFLYVINQTREDKIYFIILSLERRS